jgi:hypothetical protein
MPPFLNNKTYDTLKWIAQIFLPALATLYGALSALLGLPLGAEIVGGIIAFDAFLGVLLQLSTKSYEKSAPSGAGALVVNPDDFPGPKYQFKIDTDPAELENARQIVFKVERPPS